MAQTILITGTSSGFGELMAKTLAAKGHTVYASMRDMNNKNKDKAAALKDWSTQNNFDVHLVELDVTNEDSVRTAVAQILSEQQRIDVVINNAGIGSYGPIEGYTTEQVQHMFDVNVFGPHRVQQAVLPHLREAQKGLLIQVSSQLGRAVIPFMELYSASKFAVEAINEGLADELRPLGIDVCIIQPGGYPTDFGARMMTPEKELLEDYGEFAKKSQASMDYYMQHMASGDAPNPQEVADAVVALVEGTPGQRQRRTVVGNTIEGTKAINEVSDEAQKKLLQGFGLA